jgi:hypothetical protein
MTRAGNPYGCAVVRNVSRSPTSILVLVAAARVGVGLAMVAAPGWFFRPGSATETLLMRTIGIRDLVLGSGACAAWARGGAGDLRWWASAGLLSDSADVIAGFASRSSLGSRSAMIATLAPAPFIAAGIAGLARSARQPVLGAGRGNAGAGTARHAKQY